jgi:hypothetical protein
MLLFCAQWKHYWRKSSLLWWKFPSVWQTDMREYLSIRNLVELIILIQLWYVMLCYKFNEFCGLCYCSFIAVMDQPFNRHWPSCYCFHHHHHFCLYLNSRGVRMYFIYLRLLSLRNSVYVRNSLGQNHHWGIFWICVWFFCILTY